MSKNTNDGLTRSGTGCFIAVPMATVGVKGLIKIIILHVYALIMTIIAEMLYFPSWISSFRVPEMTLKVKVSQRQQKLHKMTEHSHNV